MARQSTSKKVPAKPKRRGRPPKRDVKTPDVPGARIIKKYGNRRLYDHTLSRTVTMDQIAAAVRRGEDVRVLDGETGADLTKRVLVQIILEEASSGQLELLPIEFLRKLIGVKSEPVGQWMERYLTAGADWLGRQSSTAGGATARAIQDSFETFFPWMRGGARAAAAAAKSDGPPPNPDADLRDEIEDLQRRLADLSTKMPRR